MHATTLNAPATALDVNDSIVYMIRMHLICEYLKWVMLEGEVNVPKQEASVSSVERRSICYGLHSVRSAVLSGAMSAIT